MKILVLLTMLPLISYCQKDADTLRAEYSEVVAQPGSAQELHNKAKKFIATAFVSSNDVLQLDNNFSLLAKGRSKVTVKALGLGYDYYMRFSFSIDCKENKYRYLISDYVLELSSPGRQPKDCPLTDHKNNWLTTKQWASVKNQAAETFTLVINSLKISMSAADNW